jgi:hypothetical protein
LSPGAGSVEFCFTSTNNDRDQKGKNMAASLQLVVPHAEYRKLVAACDRKTALYEDLANGFIENSQCGEPRVRILCDQERAQAIFAFVEQEQPELRALITVAALRESLKRRSA